MSGTRIGGRRAAATNQKKYGKDYAEYGGFYGYIGSLGGKKSKGGGFTKNRELAVEAGRKGGKASRRPKGGVGTKRGSNLNWRDLLGKLED